VVFREVKDVVKHEVLQREKDLKCTNLELKDDESNSIEEHESKEEES